MKRKYLVLIVVISLLVGTLGVYTWTKTKGGVVPKVRIQTWRGDRQLKVCVVLEKEGWKEEWSTIRDIQLLDPNDRLVDFKVVKKKIQRKSDFIAGSLRQWNCSLVKGDYEIQVLDENGKVLWRKTITNNSQYVFVKEWGEPRFRLMKKEPPVSGLDKAVVLDNINVSVKIAEGIAPPTLWLKAELPSNAGRRCWFSNQKKVIETGKRSLNFKFDPPPPPPEIH